MSKRESSSSSSAEHQDDLEPRKKVARVEEGGEEGEEDDDDELHNLDENIKILKIEIANLEMRRDIHLASHQPLKTQMQQLETECQRKTTEINEAYTRMHRNYRTLYWRHDRLINYKEKVRLIAKEETTRNGLPTCPICKLEYSNEPEKTPRLLECGHTICEGCAGRNAEGSSSSDASRIKCQFDEKETVLGSNGAQGLLRNYLLIKVLDSNN